MVMLTKDEARLLRDLVRSQEDYDDGIFEDDFYYRDLLSIYLGIAVYDEEEAEEDRANGVSEREIQKRLEAAKSEATASAFSIPDDEIEDFGVTYLFNVLDDIDANGDFYEGIGYSARSKWGKVGVSLFYKLGLGDFVDGN